MIAPSGLSTALRRFQSNEGGGVNKEKTGG